MASSWCYWINQFFNLQVSYVTTSGLTTPGAFKQTMQKSHRIFLNVLLNKTIGSFTNFQKQLASTVKFLGSLNCQTFSSENKRLIFNYEEKTMIQFILAALFFIILHIGVSGTSVRDRVIEMRKRFSMSTFLSRYKHKFINTKRIGRSWIILSGNKNYVCIMVFRACRN